MTRPAQVERAVAHYGLQPHGQRRARCGRSRQRGRIRLLHDVAGEVVVREQIARQRPQGLSVRAQFFSRERIGDHWQPRAETPRRWRGPRPSHWVRGVNAVGPARSKTSPSPSAKFELARLSSIASIGGRLLALRMAYSRITVDPRQMGGTPCIRGLRIPVSTIVGMVADGVSEPEILQHYPDLQPEDI